MSHLPRWRWFVLAGAILLLVLFVSYSEQAQLQKSKMRRKIVVNPKSTLECHRREYTYKAVNTDEKSGKKCSGYVTVESCWGRCNSGEVSSLRHLPCLSCHLVIFVRSPTITFHSRSPSTTCACTPTLRSLSLTSPSVTLEHRAIFESTR